MSENEKTITCPQCGTKVSREFKFCPNCGFALAERKHAPDQQRISAGGLGDASAERRQLTVMFCDLVGSTALSLELDPEDLRHVVQQYQRTAADCIERFEGYVAQYLGDGILAYFGYPVAHEDEAVRAVRSGRQIIRAVKDLGRLLKEQHGIDLSVRIGIHTGIVVVGEIGTGPRRENLALGETPNVAARLQAMAPENGLVVSEATARMVAHQYEMEDLGAQTLRGTRREERVFRITEERMPDSPLGAFGRPSAVSAVGRERELEAFEAHWKSIQKGEGSVLLLHGEPGIGKSHIVQVFGSQLSDRPHRKVECRCSPYLRSTPLHPFTEWLAGVLNFYPEQLPAERIEMIDLVVRNNDLSDPDAVALLATMLNVPIDGARADPGFSPSLRRERIEQLLTELLLRIGEEAPLLLVVEDLHWADPTTRSFIQRFTGAIRDRRILMVMTSRPRPELTWAADTRVELLRVERLSREQVVAVIGTVADGKSLPATVVDQIVRRTDGVPLFVQELTKMVLESGQLIECDTCYDLAADVVDLSIPSTLNDSLMARLDRLLPVKELAQVCSTLGREFSFELARVVSRLQESDLATALDRLVDAELLVSEGTPPSSRYMFRHALIQEAAYESILRSRRLQYHSRVAEHLIEHPSSKESRPEIIAHHLTRAGRRDRAASYWLLAGQEAYERWANEEALDYFTRGLALLEGVKPHPAIHYDRFFLQAGLGLAAIQLRGYTHPSVLTALEKARAFAEDLPDRAISFPVVRGIWAHYTVIGAHERARAIAQQLSELADQSGTVSRRLDADLALASTAFWRGRVEEAEREFTRIFEQHAELVDAPPPALATQHPLVGALSYRSVALWYLGFPEQAEQSGRQAIELAENVKHPFSNAFAHGFHGLLRVYLNDRAGAAECGETTVAISTRFGFPFWMGIGTVLKAWAKSDQDPEGAIAGMSEALSGLKRAGVEIWTSYPSALLAELLVEQGREDEGLNMLESVITRARDNEEGYFLPEILRIQARCMQTVGQAGRADEIRGEALLLAKEQGARPVILRILLDVSEGSEGISVEMDDLLRTTAESFTEGHELPELAAARQIYSA